MAWTEADEPLNQAPPFTDVNLYASDAALRDAVVREGGEGAVTGLERFGALAGSARAAELARLANENQPQFLPFDPQGRRIDRVEFHPAYHELMALSFAQGLHCSTWEGAGLGQNEPSGTHVARCAGCFMAAQMEAGHCCPITMTHASVASLQHEPALAQDWLPRIRSRAYDPNFAPVEEKASVTIGMGMTERQGGSDVRTNVAQAVPIDGGATYEVTGHKWFLSAPMSDAFLVLAQAEAGLSCFLLPRFVPGGALNRFRIERLKDKLGNRSNASAEVSFDCAFAWRIGEEGRGIPAIMDMVTLTRLDCAVSSAGLMRQALARALHHASYRTVFQKRLVDQPLMQRVLADMALDVEAATALAFRLARAFDRSATEEREAAYRRLMTPVAKYWICKIAPALAYEAMECLGGNGYVEEGGFPRLYREVPVNAIWEGSGNVMCLDVLRVLQKSPEAGEAILSELDFQCAGEPRLEAAVDRLKSLFERKNEAEARGMVELLALTAAGALLRSAVPVSVSDAFIASRHSGGWRHTYGTALTGADIDAILARAMPRLH
jgi:putative acyl-CoA dehydrogenase